VTRNSEPATCNPEPETSKQAGHYVTGLQVNQTDQINR